VKAKSMAGRKTNPDFMTGVPELLVLQLLSDAEMYGYELVQAVQEQTGTAISLGEGVIYPTLHALEEQGCLKSRRKDVSGRTRVYYTATAAGRKRLTTMIGEWRRITEAVAGLVGGNSYAGI